MIDFDQGFVDNGLVDKIATRNTNSGVFYNIQVDGEWFGFGKYPPKFGEGSVINFDIQFNGDFVNVNTKTLEVIEEVPAQRGGGRGQSASGGRGGTGAGRAGAGRTGGARGAPQRGAGQGNAQARGGAPAGRSASAAGSGGASKDDYWKKREERDVEVQKAIQFQASRNAAIAAVGVLLTNGAVSLPTKKAEQMDAVLELIDKITARYDTATSNLSAEDNQPNGQQYDDDGMPFDDDLPVID